MTTSNTPRIAARNSTSYGADVLRYAGLKAEADSGPLFFALAHRFEIEELSARVDDAKGNDDKVRPIIIDNLKSTPEGEEMLKEYARLLETDKKLRTAEQSERVKALHELQMQVYTQTLRNIDTLKGIVKLEQASRQVLIQRLPGTTKYACYVVSMQRDDKGNLIEVFHTPFSATQLRKIGTMQTPIDATLPTSDIGKLASSLKQGAANVDKGGSGDGIARADLGKTAHALDAAIAGTIIDGKLEGVSAPTRAEVMMLWARLDAELNEVEKAKARLEFAKLAATPEQAAATTAKEANKATMVKMLKQGKATKQAATA